MTENIFTQIIYEYKKNTPIFFIDISGSTNSILYKNDAKNRNVKIMDYEFIMVSKLAKKYNYNNCHIICWSSQAKIFKNVNPKDGSILRNIQNDVKHLISGTHLMSGINKLTDDMFDSENINITELYILTDGEIEDSKKEVEKYIKELSTKKVDIHILAFELGKKDYLNQDCHVGNTLFNYIRNCSLTRMISSFTIINSLKKEFLNFENPHVPDNYIPYDGMMFKSDDFKKFMIYVDLTIKDMAEKYNNNGNDFHILRFIHKISISIYHYIKNKTHTSRNIIIDIFSNIFNKFPNETKLYVKMRQLLIDEIDNHVAGKSTTFTESKKNKCLKIENTYLDLLSDVKSSISGNNTDRMCMFTYLIRSNVRGVDDIILRSDKHNICEQICLDKMSYNNASLKIKNYKIPILFNQNKLDIDLSNHSLLQWTKILYSRILNISPSNPNIWYYVAVDAISIYINYIKSLSSHNIHNTHNTQSLKKVYERYADIVKLFLEEEIFNTQHNIVDKIIYENNIKIDYKILKAAKNYSCVCINPLTMLILVVNNFINPMIQNKNPNIITDFHNAIKDSCSKQIAYDIFCDNINHNENLTINEIQTLNEINIIKNTPFDKLINNIYDLFKTEKKTLNSIIIPEIYRDANKTLINSHFIPDTQITCPERNLDLNSDFDTNLGTYCSFCTSECDITYYEKTPDNKVSKIYDTLYNLLKNTTYYKNNIFDDNSSVNLGMLTGGDDSQSLFAPDIFSTNIDYMVCDNTMIVDPISSSKMRINNQADFIKSVETKYPYIKNLDMENVALAGGFARSILLKQEMKDFDFFFYGLESDDAYTSRFNKLIIDIINNVRKHYASKSQLKSSQEGVNNNILNDSCSDNTDVKFGMFFKPMFNVFELICFRDPSNHINKDFSLDNFHSYKYRSMKHYNGEKINNKLYDNDLLNANDNSDDSDESDDNIDKTENDFFSNDTQHNIANNNKRNDKNDKYYFEDCDNKGIKMLHRFQIVLCKFKDKNNIIKSFDLYPSRVLFDGEKVYFTEKSLNAYRYMINEVRLLGGSILAKHRINKYFKYGFSIVFPPNDRQWNLPNHNNDYSYEDSYYEGTNENKGPLSFKIRRIIDNIILISHNSNIEKMLERNEKLEENAKSEGKGLYISSLFCSFVAILRYIDINGIDYSFPQLSCNLQDIILLKDINANNNGCIKFKDRSLNIKFLEKFDTLYKDTKWYDHFYKSLLLVNYE